MPVGAKYLILGSFPAKEAGDWFYGSKTNQFWKIISLVYGWELANIYQKKELCDELKLALGDVIARCERKKNSSLDVNLKKLAFNFEGVERVLRQNNIITIHFTSRWVEKIYRSKFKNLVRLCPQIKLIGLPSPSPRYCRLTLEEKVKKYKQLLPQLRFD